jgi:hypothetical protein
MSQEWMDILSFWVVARTKSGTNSSTKNNTVGKTVKLSNSNHNSKKLAMLVRELKSYHHALVAPTHHKALRPVCLFDEKRIAYQTCNGV